jgi:hypothetical protein
MQLSASSGPVVRTTTMTLIDKSTDRKRATTTRGKLCRKEPLYVKWRKPKVGKMTEMLPELGNPCVRKLQDVAITGWW